jgi:hypothetical protein
MTTLAGLVRLRPSQGDPAAPTGLVNDDREHPRAAGTAKNTFSGSNHRT